MGDWITDRKFTVVIVPIVIATILAFLIVVYAPTWMSTLFVKALFMVPILFIIALFIAPILAVIWFFRSK